MKFTYTGNNKQGEEVKETVEADDRFAVYEIARNRGIEILSIHEGQFTWRNILNSDKVNALINRISTDELVLITRNLSGMLTAGLPLSRALSVIERQTRNPKVRVVMSDVRERIQEGEQFNQALKSHPKVFNELYISMVRAGEESGNLSNALHLLSVQMERSSNLKKRIKGAMVYPVIVLSIMSAIGVVMMLFVMPSITGTFKEMDVELPKTTQFLIAASDFMVAHSVLTLASILGVVIFIIYFLRTRIGKIGWHFILLYLPVIGGMTKELNSARTARALSSLLSSGVDVIRAIDITTDVVQNIYYKPVLKEAREAVEKGEALSKVFTAHEKLYPIFVGEMITVGEETGQMSQMLDELAVFYENEVDRKTKDLSTIIEPLLMVMIGGAVGFFALAMIAPIYSLTDSIG